MLSCFCCALLCSRLMGGGGGGEAINDKRMVIGRSACVLWGSA